MIEDAKIGQVIEYVSLALELMGVAIIVYGSIISLAFLIQVEARDRKQAGLNQYSVKQQFTSRILTGLEFFIAGDVLKTLINPTLEFLAVIAVIIAIRAALTFLLNRELREEEKLRTVGQRRLNDTEENTKSRDPERMSASRDSKTDIDD